MQRMKKHLGEMQNQEDKDIKIAKTAETWYNKGIICHLGLNRRRK